MNILPANKSPLQGLLSTINTWKKSEKFVVRHVVTRIVSAVALPFAALATLTYHLLGEFKWGGYLIGQISWKGKKIDQLLPAGFDKRSLVSHSFHIMSAVFAIFSFPLAAIMPRTYLVIQGKFNLWINTQLTAVKPPPPVVTVVPPIVDEDLLNRDKIKSVEVVKDKRASQRLSRLVAPQAVDTDSKPAAEAHHMALPPPRGKKPRATVVEYFAQTTEYNKFGDISDLPPPPPPLVLSNIPQAPNIAAPKKDLPPVPIGPAPAPGGAKKTTAAPTARALPARPKGGAKHAVAPKAHRRSQTVDNGDLTSILKGALNVRRAAVGTLTPAMAKQLKSPVSNDEWGDDE